MLIRRAEERVIPAITHLLEQVAEVHAAGRPDIYRPGTKFTAQELAEELKGTVFVAELAGNVVGHCFCKIVRHAPCCNMAAHSSLYIDDLCVEAACRRQGVGKALYRHAREYAAAQGLGSVTLNVWAFNTDAMEFYASLGMQPQRIIMEERLNAEAE